MRPDTTSQRKTSATLWIIQGLLAGLFLFAGSMKLVTPLEVLLEQMTVPLPGWFLQFIGVKDDGMFSKVDLPKLGRTFEIPVFMIHGSEDLVAIPDVARRYFESIAAPRKEFVLVPRTGHDPNAAMIEAWHRIMSQRVRPVTK